jgi:hypothetical protein
MTVRVDPPEATLAELERPPLVAELANVRALLEAYRDGESPGDVHEPSETGGSAFEPAIDRLSRALGLSAFERQLLLLLAAVELDGDIAALAAEVQEGDDPRPTFGLALAAVPGAHWDALAPGSPLRRWLLVERGPGATLAGSPLQIDERVLQHLVGLPLADPRLDGVMRVGVDPSPLAPSQSELAREIASLLVGVYPTAVVRLDGEDAEARLGVAQEVAATVGRLPLVVRAAALPPPGPDLARLARLVDREALLLGGIPVVELDEGAGAVVPALLEQLGVALVVVVGEYTGPADRRRTLHRSVALPSPSEQRGLWAEHLGMPTDGAVGEAIEELAQHYRLGAVSVSAVAHELTADATGEVEAAAALRRLCRVHARAGLDGLAKRLEPEATWDDLVLPEGHMGLLRDIARQVRHRTQVYERWGFGARGERGLGVSALFAGESGTGKTLAAEVLACELGLDLYRIDLAATVSKYIGETEKNLRRLFDAAETSGAVLLFDEADALFGKRGEVKDSHDRYANLEVAYLLQRMESYRGLAILTTNLRSNVDRAFLRRLRFVVQFPFPDAAQRADIWRRAFPPATPLDGIDPDQLARLSVPGGSIRAIALSAAFAAAEDGTPVGRSHVLRAARVEYAKSERVLTDAEQAGLR